MYCFQETAAAASRTFTLRLNGANTTLTCTIASGATQGSTTGASVAFSAGDKVDVALPGTVDAKIATFTVAVGP